MNWSDDPQVESKIREHLYYGNINCAKDWLRQVEDSGLKESLRQLINEYEGLPNASTHP